METDPKFHMNRRPALKFNVPRETLENEVNRSLFPMCGWRIKKQYCVAVLYIAVENICRVRTPVSTSDTPPTLNGTEDTGSSSLVRGQLNCKEENK